MTICSTPFDDNEFESLPTAYGNCTCPCHSNPGTKHVVPCCYPKNDEVVRTWKTSLEVIKREEDD